MCSDRKSHYENFMIKGDFSKEFLESMGMKQIEMPLFNTVSEIQPLPGPIGLAYAEKCQKIDAQIKTGLDL